MTLRQMQPQMQRYAVFRRFPPEDQWYCNVLKSYGWSSRGKQDPSRKKAGSQGNSGSHFHVDTDCLLHVHRSACLVLFLCTKLAPGKRCVAQGGGNRCQHRRWVSFLLPFYCLLFTCRNLLTLRWPSIRFQNISVSLIFFGLTSKVLLVKSEG